MDTGAEPPVLLLHPDLEPDLDEDDPGIDDPALRPGTAFEEPSMLLGRAEAHDEIDARPIVPAAVEDHDLAPGGETLHVALHEELGLFPVRRRGQGDEAEYPWAHPLGDGLDDPALARRVAALEHDDDTRSGGLDPFLEVAELDLQLPEMLGVGLVGQLLAGGLALDRPGRHQVRSPVLPGSSLAVRLRGRRFGCGVLVLRHADPPILAVTTARASASSRRRAPCRG